MFGFLGIFVKFEGLFEVLEDAILDICVVLGWNFCLVDFAIMCLYFLWDVRGPQRNSRCVMVVVWRGHGSRLLLVQFVRKEKKLSD